MKTRLHELFAPGKKLPLNAPALLYGLAALPRIGLVVFALLRNQGSLENFYTGRTGAFWPPLPTLLLEASLQIFLGNAGACLIFYALIASAISPLTYLLAKKLNLGQRVAILSGVSAAFYPYYISVTLHQPDVGITIVLVAAVCLTFAKVVDHPSIPSTLGCVFYSLLLVADRSHALSLILFLAILAALLQRRTNAKKRYSLLLVCLLFLSMLGYSAFRYHRYGYFSPLVQKSGYNLLLGHNPFVGNYLRHTYSGSPEGRIGKKAYDALGIPWIEGHDPRYDRLLREKALEYIKKHPKETLVNTAYKAKRYWGFRLEDADNQPTWKNLAYAGPYLALILSGLVGTWHLLRRRNFWSAAFLYGGIFSYALTGLLTIPLIRVRMHSEFLLFILASSAALAWPSLTSRLKENQCK